MVAVGPLAAGGAPGPLALTLNVAVARAARTNPTLAAAIVDVRIANAQRYASLGLDDSFVRAASSWNQWEAGVVPGIPIQQVGLKQGLLDLSLIKPLRSGGEVGLHLTDNYTRSVTAVVLPPNPTELTVGTLNAPSLQLSLEHPLLQGFGAAVARADQRRGAAGRSSPSRGATAAPPPCCATSSSVTGAGFATTS